MNRAICSMIITVVVVGAVHGACLNNVQNRIAKFNFSGGARVDAVLALGKQVNACFGLRNLPRTAFLQQVTFHFQDESPLEISREIFKDQHVTILQSPDGIIDIFRPSRVTSLFDYSILSFDVGRATLQVLSQGIKNRLHIELNPESQGIAGSFYSGDESDLVGPFQVRGKTVVDLLNLIVSASKGASWLALIPDSLAVNLGATDNMWIVIEYNRPTADYKSLVAKTGMNYPDVENQP